MNRTVHALSILVAFAAAGTLPVLAEEIDLFPDGTFNADPYLAGGKDDAADAEEQAIRSAMYCDRFGPGYTLVEGTKTCIKVGGHVQVDVYVGPVKRR